MDVLTQRPDLDEHDFERSDRGIHPEDLLLLIPVIKSAIGLRLTSVLLGLYRECITRMIRIENLFNCFNPNLFGQFDDLGTLVPEHLQGISTRATPTSRLSLTGTSGKKPIFFTGSLLAGRRRRDGRE